MDYENNINSYSIKYPFEIIRGKNVYIYDENNKEYIDCLNGFGVNILGHNNDDIKNDIIEFVNDDNVFQVNDMRSKLRFNWMENLIKLLPEKMQSNYYIQLAGGSGSDAVESAIRLAKKYTNRTGLIALSGCYHGLTHGCLSLTGNIKDKVPGLIPNIQHLPANNIDFLNIIFSDSKRGFDNPSAIILELVQSDGGIIKLNYDYVKQIEKICKENNILLIIDEVQTGFGKTGTVFAFEQYDIEPDIICLSKAIGGGMPLSCILYKKMYGILGHSGTFRGNNLGFKLGIRVMDNLKNTDLLKNVNKNEKILFKLKTYKSDKIRDIRIYGGLMGIETISTELTTKLFEILLKNGVITKQGGRDNKTIIFWIPLIINENEINLLIKKIYDSLNEL